MIEQDQSTPIKLNTRLENPQTGSGYHDEDLTWWDGRNVAG